MFLFFRRYKSLDLFLLQVLQIVVRTIPTVGQNFFRFLACLSFGGFYKRHYLLFIIRSLRHRLSHDQLKNRLDRHLCVVALHKSIRPFHDARLRIRKAVLRLRLGLRFLRVFTLALGLLLRPLFQRLLGFLNPDDSRFPSLYLFCHLLSPPSPPLTSTLLLTRG